MGLTERSDLADNLQETEIVSTLNWTATEAISVTSITAYLDYDRHQQEDLDGTPVGGIFGQFTSDFALDGDQLSQEIRVNGDYDWGNWTVGLYYYDDEKTSGVNGIEFFPPGQTDSVSTIKTESMAVFGHLEYALTDQWTVLGGLRYTNDKKDADIVTLGFEPVPAAADFSTENNELTWKAGLNYQAYKDLLLYGSVQTGFKSADFHTSFLFGFIQPPGNPETTTSYEGGVKWSFLDGRGRLNAAVFYNEINQKQALVLELQGGQPVSTFLNFGDATVLGAEFELSAEITDRLNARLAVSLLDSEISASPDITFSAGPGPTTTAIDGLDMQSAPGVTASGLVRYDIPTEYGQFGLQTDFSWTDNHHFNIDAYPLDSEDSYALINLRLLWESNDGKYHAQAFVENLTDKEYKSLSLSFAEFDSHLIIWGRPIWWGFQAGVSV